MKRYFLLLAVLFLFLYLSQNSNAATLTACQTCTPSPIDPCWEYYVSGSTCYYGLSCKSGGVSFAQYWCMSFATAVDKAGPLDSNKDYCSGSSPTHYEGYAYKDSSDPRTDTQCQDKICTKTSGWKPQNKPNTNDCSIIKGGVAGNCKSGVWEKCEIRCPNGEAEGACCQEPGKKCVNSGGTLQCVTDPTCPSCYDTDSANDPKVKGTCYDTVNLVCAFTSGGCQDTCASSGAVTEYYCAGGKSCMPTQVSCAAPDTCAGGVCGTGSAGGCSWWSSTFGVCSSGCPSSYPNKQYTCCSTVGWSECNSNPACVAYDPTKGETPCCVAGGYYSCGKQEICTESGCKNVCTGLDKTSDLYCSKCNSCQDGIQNCGEPSVDKCGEPCTVPYTGTCVKQRAYGCDAGDICASAGYSYISGDPNCATGGATDNGARISCGYAVGGECYGCNFPCRKTYDIFNIKSCSDGVQNCAETCADGGPQCNNALPVGGGRSETDDSYLVTFEYSSPPGLFDTKLYSDAASLNCADGIDNDKDCLVDCADPDCNLALICIDTMPPSVYVTGAPAAWTNSTATATVTCSDDGSGCDPATYRLKLFSTNPGTCPNNYNVYAPPSSMAVTNHSWACGTAKDKKGNTGFSTPVEFKVDTSKPQPNVYGIPTPPCTLDPTKAWIDCSARASLATKPPSDGCIDADSGCNTSTYGFILYYSDPGTCPVSKSAYSGIAPLINNVSWVCGYAEDNVGNANVSIPVKFMVDKTFTIIVDARAYGEIETPPGTQVKAYLCEPSQYYCNHDAQYIATASGAVGANKRFTITFNLELTRGTDYKIGVVTERGYAESGFTA